MEASNNQGNKALPSATPASVVGDEAATPLKLQLEVTLPPALGGELRAWRKAFERIADAMERWLENSLANPAFPPPPTMPWAVAAPNTPQPAPLPAAVVATTTGTPTPQLPLPAPQTSASLVRSRPPSLPQDMPVLLSEDVRAVQTNLPSRNAEQETTEATQTFEFRPVQAPIVTAAKRAIVADNTAAEKAASQAQLGERYRAAGNKEKALVCYREALDVDADCSQAYLGRASIYIEQGRFQEALLDCNAALKREPERAVLYVLRGLVYTRLGNLKRALDESEDAIRCDPRLPSAYMLRGNVHSKKGMTTEAVADMKTAIRLRPNDAKFYVELARILTQTGQHEQAAGIYAKVLELSPTNHEARLRRGTALRQAGRASAAEAELTEYLRHRPGAAAAHYQRGLCRFAQRNYAQAMSDFDKTLSLKPGDPAAYQAREKTLHQWESGARRSRFNAASPGPAAAVAPTATATLEIPALPTRSDHFPARPIPAKTSPTKPKPSRPKARRWRDEDDEEPGRWVAPAKWVGVLSLVGLLGFGGYRLFAGIVMNPYRPDKLPQASVKLSVDDLLQRYQQNPAAAKTELSEHVIELTGMVARHFDDKDPPVVLLSASRSPLTVTCTLKPGLSYHQQMLLSRIQGDSKATIVGTCSGLQGKTIVLNECLLVRVIRGNDRARR